MSFKGMLKKIFPYKRNIGTMFTIPVLSTPSQMATPTMIPLLLSSRDSPHVHMFFCHGVCSGVCSFDKKASGYVRNLAHSCLKLDFQKK